MKQCTLGNLNEAELQALCKRPSITFDVVLPTVQSILHDVRRNGDEAIKRYEAKFGGQLLDALQVTEQEVVEACRRVSAEVKAAFEQAAKNIERFHENQIRPETKIETLFGKLE